MKKIEYAMILRALLWDISECGDLGYIKEYDNKCFVCLIDILGHGKLARSIAVDAEEYLEANYQRNLVDVMNGLHKHLYGSRGGVVLMCRLDIPSEKLQYTGIGNVTGRVIGSNQHRMLSKDGIVGFGSINPVIRECDFSDRDLLILYSDGIKEHFNLLDHLALFTGETESIARGVLKEFGKKTDDACCIVLKYIK
jgi:hypothetical protein